MAYVKNDLLAYYISISIEEFMSVKCHVCREVFIDAVGLNEHKQAHVEGRLYTCAMILEIRDIWTTLLLHIISLLELDIKVILYNLLLF